jgi:hypothetical protein
MYYLQLLFEVMQKYCDGINLAQNVEEMLHSLQIEDEQFRNQTWYQRVKQTITSCAAEISQTLQWYTGEMKAITGSCPFCCCLFYLYATYCEDCKQLYCIWCQFYEDHEHTMFFVSNF